MKKSKPVKTSQFKGVSWAKNANKWVVHITTNGKMKHIGCFANEIDAAKAYDEQARKHFGEHALANFP